MITPAASTGIRPDFARTLRSQLETAMGRPGSVQHQKMTQAFSSFTSSKTGEIDLNLLPEKVRGDLKKLQDAAEGFEGIFVKGLLSQMRKSSFAEKQGPYGELAQDLFDQAVSEQTAKSGEGLGIASRVFDSTAPRLVREAAARFLAEQAANPGKETPHAPTH